jgi:putative ABC transport system permease protein
LWATGARTTTSRSGRRSLNVLVAGEIALAMTLSVGAALLLEAFWKICRVPAGFRVDGVLTYRISLPPEQYKDGNARQALFESHLEQVRTLPGVQTASFTSMAPGDGYNSTRFDVEGVELAPGEINPTVLIQTVMADYFETMGIELLAGRLFTAQDYHADGERTVIINETFAKRLGSNREALDKHIAYQGSKDWMRVIGVTRDIKFFGLDKDMGPALYLPCGPNPPHSMAALVHTAGDPLALAPVIQDTLRSVDPSLSIHWVRTMRDRVRAFLWFRRTYSWLIGVFAVVAMVMAVGGIYGITSYSVSQRTQEIGIRLAFGARAGDIARHVLIQGARLVAIGLGVGLIGALAMGQLMAGLLFGVSAMDPLALLGVAILLLAVTLLACYLPARRAARVDPMVALRCE